MSDTRLLDAAVPDAVAEAAALLKAGKLVAFPTETVYGLGANAADGRAVAGIFEAKGRPRFNPLIVHVPNLEAANRIAVINGLIRQIANTFWPGPLTLVCPVRPDAVADMVTAGLETVAVRVPAHPLAQELLRAAAIPVAAPSANPSGRISPTWSEHVMEGLSGRIDAVLDGDPCAVGLESTIVGFPGGVPSLLRAGGLAREEIEVIAGPLAGHHGDITAPGQMTSHYAPRNKLRLNAALARPGEGLLAFGPHLPPHDGPLANLSETGDLREAAANLFHHLRLLDGQTAGGIAAMSIPGTGLGEAINDRLARAAAGKPAT